MFPFLVVNDIRKKRRSKYDMLPFLVVNDISFRILNKNLDLKKIVYLPVSEQRNFLWPYIFRIVDKMWKTEYN